MLGKQAELFGTQDYIDYQMYIGQLTQTELDRVWDGQEHNWFDEVFAPSWSQQHSLTFSGGNNKGHFFTSLNYVDNDGRFHAQLSDVNGSPYPCVLQRHQRCCTRHDFAIS